MLLYKKHKMVTECHPRTCNSVPRRILPDNRVIDDVEIPGLRGMTFGALRFRVVRDRWRPPAYREQSPVEGLVSGRDGVTAGALLDTVSSETERVFL